MKNHAKLKEKNFKIARETKIAIVCKHLFETL